jgi:hypothetical protein
MPTTTEVSCPKCGGAMWDNRETKKNPKAPDYKCKDRSCDGVIWPPKPGQRSPVSAPPAEKQAYSAGPHINGLDDAPIAHAETGAPPSGAAQGVDFAAVNRLNKQFSLYDACLAHAHSAATRLFGNDVTDEAVAAMAATLYIQANK